MEWLTTQSVLLIFHILGTAIGAGAAFLGDLIFITSVRRKILDKKEAEIMHLAGKFVWLGLIILIISGIGLVLERPQIFLNSGKFWAKMSIVTFLALNGLAFHFIHRPIMLKSVGQKFSHTLLIIQKRYWLLISGVVSVVSWNFAIILGVLGRTPFGFWHFIGAYLLVLTAAGVVAVLIKDKILSV